ncbi:MAG: hypothetical protein Q4G08_03195 [Capnocytophaga sp.]|nr:hypothetical protein [Capnocytophaga sp.]
MKHLVFIISCCFFLGCENTGDNILRITDSNFHNTLQDTVYLEVTKIPEPGRKIVQIYTIPPNEYISFSFQGEIMPIPFEAGLGTEVVLRFGNNCTYYKKEGANVGITFGNGVFDWNQYAGFSEEKIHSGRFTYDYYIDQKDLDRAVPCK